MLTTQSITFTRPQDKHGLLVRWRKEKAPVLLKQLEQILSKHRVKTVLDLTSDTRVYASGLEAKGWQVTASRGIPDDRTFDAVICMDNEYVQYLQPDDRVAALRSMFDPLNMDGVAIFCAPDFDLLLESPEDKVITPLLLGSECGGQRGSVIRHMSLDIDQGCAVADFIYHLQDLATGAVTADWETAVCGMLCVEGVYDLIQCVDGYYIHGSYPVAGERLFVYGKVPDEDAPLCR